MLQGDQDRDYGFLRFRSVDIDAVFVMQGNDLLADDGDDVVVLIIELKIQAENIAAELPPESFDVGNILDDVEKLVGNLEAGSILHSHKVTLVESEEFSGNKRHVSSCGIVYVCFVVQGRKFRIGGIDDLFICIGNGDPMMQCKDLGGGKKRADRFAKPFHIVDIGLFTGFSVAVYF